MRRFKLGKLQFMQEIQIPPPELIETSKLTVHKTHLNPNKMTREQLDRLKTSIKKFGFIVPIITNKDLVIADGEQRWIVANELAMPKVLVVRLPVEEVDRLLIQQVMNSQAVRGMHDLLLDAMSFENIIDLGGKDDLKYLLDLTDGKLERYLNELHPPAQEDEFEGTELEKVQTDIKQGDIIQLENHRLMCGDSSKDSNSFVKDITVKMVLTDPPYDIILDLFGGSGSTLIACEQTGRTCYMMEIDPRYCEIIAQRWEKYTGQKRKIIKNCEKPCTQEKSPS
jgi:hypothetical protein